MFRRVASLALVLAVSASAQTRAGLVAGVPIERSIAVGERHSFDLPVNGGEVVKITADQLGADVVVDATFGARPAASADETQKHHFGREVLLWHAPSAGTLTIGVRAKSVMPAGGRYRLLATVYPATDAAAAGADEFNAAVALAQKNPTREAAAQAAAHLRAALQRWRELDDREMIAVCLNELGQLQAHELMTPKDAIATLADAAAMFEALALPTERADALATLGYAQIDGGEADRALQTFERAMEGSAELDPVTRGLMERDIVRVTMDTGDLERAAASGERAVATLHEAGAQREEFQTLQQLSLAYSRMQRFDDALGTITQGIGIARQVGKPFDVATLMVVAGRIQMAAGDDDAALAAYREALDLFGPQPSGNRFVALLSIGRLHNRLGDPTRGREVLQQALDAIPAQAKDLWAATASELGASLRSLGDAAAALDLQRRALDIVDGAQSRVGQLTVLRDLVVTYRTLGDMVSSNAMIDRASKVAGEMPGQAYDALFLRERALNARAAGDLPAARAYLDRALEVVESERGRLQSQALRASFGSTLQSYYGDAIGVAMQMHAAAPRDGHDARAFELFERSRARGFSDLLAEGRVDVKSGADAGAMAERRDLERQLGAKDAALRDLGGNAQSTNRAAALEREIGDIGRRLVVVEARIRSSSPRYAALAHPNPASLADAQRLLDDGTVFVAISLGSPSSWGWAVTRSGVRSFALPAAADVERQARQVYADLTARQNPSRRRASHAAADVDRELERDAAALSDVILGPIAEPLAGEWRSSRLAIVVTGALEYIPFAALPLPSGSESPGGVREWLVDRHELVQLPSVSVLAQLRKDEPSQQREHMRVAVLADPVYEADDPRVARAAGHARSSGTAGASARARAAAEPPSGADALTRGIDERSTRVGFGRLLFSRDEANAIAALASADRVVEALDFDASVQTMAGPRVADARIIHVASHGILNSARPELSGLVLSLVDRRGRPTEGVLHLYDILNLKLSADLVVLSACQTGLGREMKGEGLVGLSRAFMYAGAPRVVASLWQVDDFATAELMKRFYRGVLVDRLQPAAALAAAQREMRRHARWRSPYYWAGFTVIGDWR